MSPTLPAQRYWDDVAVGDAIPGFDLPLDWSRMAMQVSGSQDFYPVHHDPDFARAYLTSLPDVARIAGFYMGPDGYTWGREFVSTEPDAPRQLVIRKMWYSFFLWGRLAFEPALPNTRFQQVLAARFPGIASGDLFVFPSHSETFGNVTLEAMASGVPTIAFDYGAAREHLHDGLHGAALALDDDAGFIEAVTRIAVDDRRRKAMAEAGRRSVASLHPPQVAQDFDVMLRSLALRRLDESLVLA